MSYSKCLFCKQTKRCDYLSYEFDGNYCNDCMDIAMKMYEFINRYDYNDRNKMFNKIYKLNCNLETNENCRSCDYRFFCYTR